jgi:hypothetical protein
MALGFSTISDSRYAACGIRRGLTPLQCVFRRSAIGVEKLMFVYCICRTQFGIAIYIKNHSHIRPDYQSILRA